MESRVSPLLRPYLSLLILVPVSDETDKQKLHEMVTDINQTQVEAEEVLADSVYLYQRHNQEIIQLY